MPKPSTIPVLIPLEFIVLSDVILVLAVQVIIIRTLHGKVNRKAAIVLSAAWVISISIAYSLPITDSGLKSITIMFVSLLFAYVLPVFVFKGIKKRQAAYIATFVLGLITLFSVSIGMILSQALAPQLDGDLFDLLGNSAALMVGVLSPEAGVFYKAFRSILETQLSMKVLLVFMVWTSALLLAVSLFIFKRFPELAVFRLAAVLIGVLVILVGVMCPLLITYNLSSKHYKKLSDLMDKQVRAQVTHYGAMSKVNEDIRRFHHDYNNMRLGLVDFLKRDDAAGALAFLETDEMSLTDVPQAFTTGSIILDALLNEKQVEAAGVNTSINFSGVVPGNLINPADICAIFGNALDNAIEACSKYSDEEKRVIVVQADVSHGYIFIKIENPTVSDVHIINNTVTTSKENRNAHGFGLRSIQKAVEKYSGDMKLQYEDGVFRVAIDLYLNQLVA